MSEVTSGSSGIPGEAKADVDIIDIEEYAKQDKPVPPQAKGYRFRVDRELVVSETPRLTGQKILSLAGKRPPERFNLRQRFKGGKVVAIALDQVVDLTGPGVERFTTIPKDQTEGCSRAR